MHPLGWRRGRQGRIRWGDAEKGFWWHRGLIHVAANFASFFAFRGLSINESTFWRMVWKLMMVCAVGTEFDLHAYMVSKPPDENLQPSAAGFHPRANARGPQPDFW